MPKLSIPVRFRKPLFIAGGVLVVVVVLAVVATLLYIKFGGNDDDGSKPWSLLTPPWVKTKPSRKTGPPVVPWSGESPSTPYRTGSCCTPAGTLENGVTLQACNKAGGKWDAGSTQSCPWFDCKLDPSYGTYQCEQAGAGGGAYPTAVACEGNCQVGEPPSSWNCVSQTECQLVDSSVELGEYSNSSCTTRFDGSSNPGGCGAAMDGPFCGLAPGDGACGFSTTQDWTQQWPRNPAFAMTLVNASQEPVVVNICTAATGGQCMPLPVIYLETYGANNTGNVLLPDSSTPAGSAMLDAQTSMCVQNTLNDVAGGVGLYAQGQTSGMNGAYITIPANSYNADNHFPTCVTVNSDLSISLGYNSSSA